MAQKTPTGGCGRTMGVPTEGSAAHHQLISPRNPTDARCRIVRPNAEVRYDRMPNRSRRLGHQEIINPFGV